MASDHHHPYATIPEATECAVDLTQIFLGGWDNAVARKAEVLKHEHTIQGTVFGAIVGEPDGPFQGASADEEAELGDRLAELAESLHAARPDICTNAALSEVKNQGFKSSGDGLKKIDWKKWFDFLITYVLPIILTL